MSDFWSVWITVLTVITLIGMLWLLFANRKIEKKSADLKTGHVFDGIEEYDNPLPGWWMNLFLLTVFFSIAYLIAYPGLGNFKGMLNWTQEDQWQQEMKKADAAFLEVYGQFDDKSIAGLASNRQAVKMGQRMFANNCSVCHGADAGGTIGFPNLRDDTWLYGGAPEQILQSIAKGRNGVMPEWGPSLGDDKVSKVADYVLAMSQGDAEKASVAEGKDIYGMFCMACHGVNGEGNIALGAPHLNDTAWLYGGSKETIVESIRNGRNSKMPAHEEILSAEKIKLISAYVYHLSKD